jgi:hypothetical protein
LNSTKITDAGLAHLQSLPNLYDVSAQDTRVTEAGLKKFSGARPHTLASGR